MIGCVSKHFGGSLFIGLFLAVNFAFASSFNAAIYPLVFEDFTIDDSVSQMNFWDKLIKYKLFGTGTPNGDGVVFKGQHIFISDTIGYTGSAVGNLVFKNDGHMLGGPVIFGGGFTNDTGPDTLTGPARFEGYFQMKSQQDPEHPYTNTFMGKYCFDGGYGDSSLIQGKWENHAYYAVQNGKGEILSAADCANEKVVPFVETNLDIPVLDEGYGTTGNCAATLTQVGKTQYIHVPPYGLESISCNMFFNEISLGNDEQLIVLMPTGGRLTKIFVQNLYGLGSTSNNNVIVAESNSNSYWDGTHWDVAEDKIRLITNADYAGNLLFYTPNDLKMSAAEKNIQGTYISGGDITFAQHTHFAGQLLAKHIYIDAEFDAKDFRYVPFDPSKVKVLNKNGLTEIDEKVGDDIQLSLDKAAPTKVPFRYCFEFFATDPAPAKAENNHYAHRSDLVDANLPVCTETVETVNGSPVSVIEGDFFESSFAKGQTTLSTPIVLHAAYDALTENNETFRLWVCDLEAAVFPDNDRSGNCYKYDLTIKNVPKNPLSRDTSVTGFMNDPIVISSFPAMYADSSLLTDYSIKIETVPAKAGALTLNGVAVKVGDVIDVNSLSGLVYMGGKDEFGAPYDSFTFSMVKNEDRTESEAPYTLTINLVSVMFAIEENPSAGDLVGTMENDYVNPSFAIIDPFGVFTINSSTGKISVIADSTIDYEEKPEGYMVSVVITSGSVLDTVAAQIKVIDVDDPPSIRDTAMSVSENKPVGTSVGVLDLYDQDGPNSGFRNNKFSIVGGDADKFKINATSGEITTSSVFDYEALPAGQKFYTISVQVADDHGYVCSADVKINIVNVVEKSLIVVTHAISGTGDYNVNNPENLIKINDKNLTLSWTGDGNAQPDTVLKNLHEGYNVVALYYYDKTKDEPATKNVTIFVCTKTPEVDVSTKVNEVVADNIYTIVEPIEESDTSFYVNSKVNNIELSIKDPVLDATYTDSTCNYTTKNVKVKVQLEASNIPANVVKNMNEVVGEKLVLNDMPSGTVLHTPYNDSLVMVSYTEKVKGVEVTVSYINDAKGELVNDQIKVSYKTVVAGKEIVVSYMADAYTGEPVTNLPGAVYTVAYDYIDNNKNSVNIAYAIDSDGKVVHDADGNIGFEVGFTYTNEIGNSASKSIYVVLDVIPPVVEILSPAMDEVIFSNSVDVKWTVDKGTGDGPVVQDTLVVQGLERGGNAIIRSYKDKAGNRSIDTVYVVMKDAKDVDISVETPVTLVTRDKADEYYAQNPPADGETFAISIYNSKTGKEVETQVGGDFDTKTGSLDEPYPGLKKHLGPTLVVEAKVPVMSAVTGLATMDDIMGSEGLVNLDGVDATGGEKMPLDQFVKDHCSAEFQSSFDGDASRASLYHTVMTVKIWVFTTLGSFVDYFSFEQDIDDPDYVNDAGMLYLYFEMKPDKNGDVRTASGRLYGTGAYVYKTDVTMKSTLQCDLPPLKNSDSGKIGAVRKVSEDLLKPFGYKRPQTK